MTATCPGNTILDRLFRHAGAFSDCLAYTFLRDNGEAEALTFAQLAGRVRTVAEWLQEHAALGDRALLLYPPGLAFIETFLACLATGVIAVPAYPPRRHRAGEAFRSVIEDAQPRLVLTTRQTVPAIEAGLAGLGSPLPILPSDEAEKRSGDGWRPPVLGPDTIAFLQFTSGSTGAPKGVIVTHGNIAVNEQQIERSFGHVSWSGGEQRTVVVSWLPLFHDMGLIGDVLQPLYVGCPAIRMSPVAFLQEPVKWLKAISHYRGTTSGGPNFAYDYCVQHITEEQKKGLDLSCWKVAYNGAEPVRAETLDRFAAAFASCGFRPEAFFPCYGMAETTLFVSGGPHDKAPARVCVCSDSLEAHRLLPVPPTSRNARQLVSCGQLAEGTRVAIVDPETFVPCPPGKVGEVWVNSPSVARGYWNRPEETEAIFQARLAEGDDGPFLRTGDAGFLLDGELYLAGRLKDLIIIRGRNLYPQDVESTVERVVPFARANTCAAFGVEVDGAERLAVVIEADRALVQTAQAAEKGKVENGPSPAAQLLDLVGSARAAISEEFEVLVYAVVFVRPGTFPRTSSGKVRRRVCRAGLLAGELNVVHAWQAGGETRLHVPSAPSTGEAAAAQRTERRGLSAEERVASREKADQLIHWLRAYAEHRLNSRLIDERRCVPPHVILDFGNQGLFGLRVPRQYGGCALGALDLMRVQEQVAALDLTLAVLVGDHSVLAVRPILQYASEALRRELLPALASGRQLVAFALTEPEAGSNPNAIRTVARREPGGWRLRGEKRWIGLASWAGVICVFANAMDENGQPLGPLALAVRARTQGLRHGPESPTLGLRGIVQNTVSLKDAWVPEGDQLGAPGEGMRVAHDAMNFSRVGLGSICLGGMKRCAQLMVRYAQRRNVSTGRLLDNAVTLALMADLTGAIAATEALVHKVAEWIDDGEEVSLEAYLACKTSAPELLWKAADRLMQLLGGRGYVEMNVAPQLLRDARIFRIFEGPTEALNTYLGANVLHRDRAITRLLAEGFLAPDVAEDLRAAVEELRGQAAEGTLSAQWLGFQVGELATAAILRAAIEDRNRQSQGAFADAVEWARRRYQRALGTARTAAPPTAQTASLLVERAQQYAESIGDVEQQAAGEDDQMDSYLTREWPRPSR
jgi:acyl-CoA synthetase (AMP-forming)/AMP-acid ligase II/alkylation response protein AidB-like acyl-CoA dehydrogenase